MTVVLPGKYGILGWSLRLFHDQCTGKKELARILTCTQIFSIFSQEGLQSVA